MSRRKKVASVAFTGVATLGTVGLTAGHAHAATLGTVTNVVVTPPGPFTAKNVPGTSPTLTEGTNTLTCTTATAKGSLTGSPTGSTVGTVSSATFTSCSLDGFNFHAHLKSGTHATLFATSPTVGGVTKGKLTGISASLSGSAPLFSTCHAKFTGTLSGSYFNSTGVLKINPGGNKTLTTSGVTAGCQGLLTSGTSNAGFVASYSVKDATGGIPVVSAT